MIKIPTTARDFGAEDGGDDPMVMQDERDLKPTTGRGRIQTGTIRDPILRGDAVDYTQPGTPTAQGPTATTSPVSPTVEDALESARTRRERMRDQGQRRIEAVRRALIQQGMPRSRARRLAVPVLTFFQTLSALRQNPTRARYERAKSAYISLIKAVQM